MPVRKGEAPKRIPDSVKFKGLSERLTIKLVWRNVSGSEYRELAARLTLGQLLIELIEEWDAEYDLSTAGIEALEDERPGVPVGLLDRWHKARALELEGN